MALEQRASLGESIEIPITGPRQNDENRLFGSDQILDLLDDLGYRYIAINPGSSFRGLHDSIVNYHGNRQPQLLLCLHEEVAVSLAHGYSKGRGGPAAVAIHDLVGLMHASMAVYNAFLDRTPILILGGSGPRNRLSRRPIDWIHSADTQAELIRNYVKWDDEPTPSAAFVPSIIKAHQIAHSAPKGPTYISLDCLLQEEEVPMDSRSMHNLAKYRPSPPIYPDPESIRMAAELLAAADFPLVIAGRTGIDPEITPHLIELVELLGAAYLDERNSVSFPTDHPNNCNVIPEISSDADIILAIDVVDLPSMLMRTKTSSKFPGAKIIELSIGDIGNRSWSNASAILYDRDIHVLSDPLKGITSLVSELSGRMDKATAGERNQKIAAQTTLRHSSLRRFYEQSTNATPISQVQLVTELWNAVKGTNWILALRNTRSWPEGIWKFQGSGEYLGHSGGGGVGYGPGAMVGASLAAMEDGKIGVGIIGDGDFLMASSALWTATHYKIPMLMVINDNNSFYNDEPHQQRVAQKRGRTVENSWIGMRITDPTINLAQLAGSYGCQAFGPIDNATELRQSLKQGIEYALDGKTVVVHVLTAR